MGERGIEVPVDEHHADQWYVCAEVRLPDAVEHHPFLMVFPTNPKTRGGLMSPVGDGTFYVSLSGKSADVVPRTFDEMQLYARTLEDSCIADRLEGAVALGVPLYSNAAGVVPLVEVLHDKGMPMGLSLIHI